MPSDIQGIAGNPAVSAAPPQTTSATADLGWSFHDVLSALNPLQYLPVVGTIYRAVTGDVIPEGVRRFGSMLVSGLAGGPVGLAINIATTLAEKVTGIDPDKIVTAELNPLRATAGATAQSPVIPPQAASAPAAPVAGAWTPEQLTAYGVSTNTAGNLTLGTIEGADVLNAIQLANLNKAAAAAYAANQPVASGLVTHPA
jgi:hypothetical protein